MPRQSEAYPAPLHPRRYEGSIGELGEEKKMPKFKKPAPALLGFDETIEEYCTKERMKTETKEEYKFYNHAENSLRANMNILSLHGERLPYNICRSGW